jgi:uncharacterized protein (TIGR02246 family)
MKRIVVWFIILCAGAPCWLLAQQSNPRDADEAAIRESVASYTAAFNKHDAKALAATWSPEAVYTNPVSGEEVTGREQIERQFAGVFAGLKGAKLDTKIDSIRFVSPNVAIENGTATVTGADGKSSASTYTAVHVKRDGKWLLDRVTEQDEPEVVSRRDRLKDLEWMIGKWVDEDDNAKVEMNCQWAKNESFIVRTFSASVRDQIKTSGVQIIGWDAAARQFRSWVFDSDGGFGEAVWTKKGNRWIIQAKDTSGEGQKMTSQNILKVVDKDTFTWQSVDRQADGELLPNVDEVVVVRVTTDE